MTRQRGFTLIELLIAVILIGIISIMLSPFFKMFMTAKEQSYREQQTFLNQKVSRALLMYAKQATALGTLPAPYSNAGTKNYNAPANTADATLLSYLLQLNVPATQINEDGTTAGNVRVFQRVTGLSQQVPFFFQSGPLVTLAYEFGAVYMSGCPHANANPSCNPNSALGIPGASPVMNSGNFTTWAPVNPDLGAITFSTLPLQKEMLVLTAKRTEKIRENLGDYFRTKMLAAAANDTTNWYPTGATSLGGLTPTALNNFCRDGWYDLSTATVLPQIGLSAAEYGITAWGGKIEYCRDYDPAVTGANTPPHYSAIRFHKNVSQGIAPDAAVGTNNIVLSL